MPMLTPSSASMAWPLPVEGGVVSVPSAAWMLTSLVVHRT